MEIDHNLSDDRAVLTRAAKLLQAFSGHQRVLTLNELTLRSGLPKTTTHRLAAQLVGLGWLDRGEDGYRIGMPLFKAGRSADRRVRLRHIGLPHLQDLASATGLATGIAVLSHGEVLCLENVPGARFRLPVLNGARMPASCTSLGKALLAHASRDQVEAVLAAPLSRRTTRSITDAATLAEQLANVRNTGVATADGEMFDGISCVAVPVWGDTEVVAAIAVSGPSAQVRSSRAAPALRAAATHMAAAYGTRHDLRVGA